MGWMVRLGESHVGRRLILVFAPTAGRRDEIVHEESGGPGRRRICTRCGATVDEGQRRCPVDGGRVVDVTVRRGTTAASADATAWAPPADHDADEDGR